MPLYTKAVNIASDGKSYSETVAEQYVPVANEGKFSLPATPQAFPS